MFRRRRSEEDFAEEIRSHLALEADELEREGMSPEEAQRKARIEFGNVSVAKERFYLEARIEWIENAFRDLKFAIRQLVKNRGFAVTAIFVLSLGMGASMAIFAFVDAALIEPLPYRDPDRLMSVNESSADSPRWQLSYLDYLDWQSLTKSFDSLDIYAAKGFLLRTPSGQEPILAERVSGGFFKTLGVRPMLGRDFLPNEDRLGGPNLVLLSYGTWTHRFGGNREIIGQTIELNGDGYTVIGVLPRSFVFAPAANAEFWVPINTLTPHQQFRNFYSFWGLGRLRDGVTVQTALAEMNTIERHLQRQNGLAGPDLGASVIPLSEVIVGKIRPILLTLMSGAMLLLIIACVNVASLVLVRSESRRREIAVRAALGASGARLVRQFVTEGLLLAVFGAIAGSVVAGGLVRLLARIAPKDMASNMPFLEGAGLNAPTAVFGIAVGLLAALAVIGSSLIRLACQDVREGLSDGDRGTANRLWRRLGANLVVVELAIAVVLLVGGGLLGKSLYRLLNTPLGFDPNNVATLYVKAPDAVYRGDKQIAGLYREIEQRLSNLPEVQSVALTSMLPVQCNCPIDRIHFPSRSYRGEHNDVVERHVSPGYLASVKASLTRGRFFTGADAISRPGVVVINQEFARRYFPSQDPIGQKIANEESGRPSVWEIVGIVNDIREGPLDAAIEPTEYFPIQQAPDHSCNVAVRTRQDAAAMLPRIVAELHQISPDLGISDEATMNQVIDTTQTALLHRSSAWLVGGFSGIALVLGVVGLYGIIAYSVSQRTREIGIRIALGAQRGSVYRLVMRQAGSLTAIGLVIGLACSAGTSMMIRNLLFGVRAWDAFILGGVTVLVGLSALVASFLPAQRAASVNPTDALRTE